MADIDENPDRLRAVAEAASAAWFSRAVELTPLGQGPTHTYRLDLPDERFLLRVHAPATPPFTPLFYTPEGLESECAWLAALAAETELTVPQPVEAPGGGYVHLEGAAPCTLMRWVAGEVLEGRRTAEQARLQGELLVALHEHAEGWTPPPDFARPTLDHGWVREAVRRCEGLASSGVLPPEHLAVVSAAVALALEELPEPSELNLIHADLHGENYLFHEGEIRPIDFARCGWGTWLLDLAESLQHHYPQERRVVVETYAALRPLRDGDVRRLESYMVRCMVETYGYHSVNSTNHGWITKSIASVCGKHLRAHLDGRPWLFEM